MDYEDTDEYEYDQADEFYDENGDNDYWDDKYSQFDDESYEDYEYEVYTPVFTWRDWSRLRLIELRQTIGRQIDRWNGFKSDPGAIVRRCKYCGKRGCVAGTEVCWNDTIPF